MKKFTSNDYPEICSWYQGHNQVPPDLSLLPKLGFIEPGVAAGFLIVTDIGVGIIDSFISNPAACPALRDLALDAIAAELLTEAKRGGMCAVKFETSIGAIEKRALKFDFKPVANVTTYMRGL